MLRILLCGVFFRFLFSSSVAAEGDIRPKRFMVLIKNIGRVTTSMQNLEIIPTQVQLLNFFMDNGYPVSAGVICDTDAAFRNLTLHDTLNRCVGLAKDKCSLFNTPASNGDYSSPQSTEATIRQCDQNIKSYFQGYQAEAVVSNWNIAATKPDFIQASLNIGYLAISDISGYTTYPFNISTNPLQLPTQAVMGELRSEFRSPPSWYNNSKESILAKCLAAYQKGEDCGIVVDPEEFFWPDFSPLKALFDYLSLNGWKFTSFHQIIGEFTPSKSPSIFPTLSPSAPPTIAATVAPWGKCGGQGWPGPFICPLGFQCVVDTIWYSQCRPIPSRSPTRIPSSQKTSKPSFSPTVKATVSPTVLPSKRPTSPPTLFPSRLSMSTRPTYSPTRPPSKTSVPTCAPIRRPTLSPTPKPIVSSTMKERGAVHKYLRTHNPV